MSVECKHPKTSHPFLVAMRWKDGSSCVYSVEQLEAMIDRVAQSLRVLGGKIECVGPAGGCNDA